MRFHLLITILLVAQSFSFAESPVALQVRLIDVPMNKAPSMSDPSLLSKAIAEAPTVSSIDLFVAGTENDTAKLGGVIDSTIATEFDPTELPGTVRGIIHPGGMPRTTATPTAFQTHRIGSILESRIEHTERFDSFTPSTEMDAELTVDHRDFLGLVDRSFQGGDPIPMPRFKVIRPTFSDPISMGDEWIIIGSGESPRDRTQLRLICARALTAQLSTVGREASAGTQIRTVIEVFEIAPASTASVLSTITSASDHSAARKMVGDLLAANSAREISTHFFTQPTGTIAGQIAGYEEIYPSSGDPPELPNFISGEFKANGNNLGTHIGHTSFETTLCGPKIHLEATAFPDNQLVDCSVHFLSQQLDIHQQFGSHLGQIYIPNFARHYCNTRVIAQTGKPQLLALFTPPLRTSHQGETHTSSALDAPNYAVTGGSRIAIFLTTTIQSTTP